MVQCFVPGDCIINWFFIPAVMPHVSTNERKSANLYMILPRINGLTFYTTFETLMRVTLEFDPEENSTVKNLEDFILFILKRVTSRHFVWEVWHGKPCECDKAQIHVWNNSSSIHANLQREVEMLSSITSSTVDKQTHLMFLQCEWEDNVTCWVSLGGTWAPPLPSWYVFNTCTRY
jgi:hypothetical protein